MHTHNFATSKIEIKYAIVDPILVGPSPNKFVAIWTKLINTNSWPSWLIGVDKVLATASTTMARGSVFELVGRFGSGEIEILRWNPETELILLLRLDGLRLAFSIYLSEKNIGENGRENSDKVITIEGEYELSGWKNAFWPFYRLFLKRRQQQMIAKLDLMLNQASKTH